ncbi:MAG: IS21 family transposase [bacterium]
MKKILRQGKGLGIAAAKSGMDEKTARKYRDLGKLPNEVKAEQIRHWRTRSDPFTAIWDEAKTFLEANPGLEAKTVFEHFQRQYPGKFHDGQLRTFQRKVKNWRAIQGPAKEIYFPQVHEPGKLSQSDFTHMNDLGITIDKHPFDHLVYHFVLTYSNWEAGTICFSESLESLSEGLQNAFWKLGGVPKYHQTDRLSTAVNKPDNPEEFTRRYQGILNHYNITGLKTNPASPHENGDVEQRHNRFKKALDQALMLRGSRDFNTREEYAAYLDELFAQLNRGRRERFQEERIVLRSLPSKKLNACSRLNVKVGPSSTIRVKHKVYSVHSRLIGETVTIRLYAERLEIWYGQRHIENIPRLRGSKKHYIQYRHIIDWLVRKPGAFENYRYRSDLFPTSRFRIAYDTLRDRHSHIVAGKEYLKILRMAAGINEAAVDDVLRGLINQGVHITAEEVEKLIQSSRKPASVTEVNIESVALQGYDKLLQMTMEVPI